MAMEQGLPPEAAAAPAEGGADQLSDLISNITDGLAMLTEVMGQVSPESGAELESLSQGFQGIISKAMSGGQAASGQGMANAQAGVGKAVPAGPQGVARG